MIIKKLITEQDSENLVRYFAEARKHFPISKAEEKALIIRIQKDNDQLALDKLIKANMRFVISVAKQYQGQGQPLLDLIAEGNTGLVEAARRFDTGRDLKFISYAVLWIRLKIFTSLDTKYIVRLPANRALLIDRIKRETSIIERKLERMPSIEELESHLNDIQAANGENNLSRKEILEAISYGCKTKSLQEKVGNDDEKDIILEDVIKGDMDVDDIQREESFLKDINNFLYNLTQHEYDVLCLSMGLNGELAKRNMDIASVLRIKEKEIMKLKSQAIKRLRKAKNISSLKDYLQ